MWERGIQEWVSHLRRVPSLNSLLGCEACVARTGWNFQEAGNLIFFLIYVKSPHFWMLTYKIMFLKEKTHWERHKILLQVKDCPQATWLQPLAWTRLKSVLPANTQELELCSQTVQSSQWEQHSWWINLNSYHGGMGRQAGVLALWAFLSFVLTMGGKAVQTPAGYESSPEGICPSHGL